MGFGRRRIAADGGRRGPKRPPGDFPYICRRGAPSALKLGGSVVIDALDDNDALMENVVGL